MLNIIANGSEKQNSWAQQIAEDSIKRIDSEIEIHSFRASDDTFFCMIEILVNYKSKAIEQLAKMTSKQIIDAFTSGNKLDVYVIKMAKTEAEKRVSKQQN